MDFVHIGLQKAASTSLQHGLFVHHPQLQVAVPNSKTGRIATELLDLKHDPFDPGTWRERFDRAWESQFERDADQNKLSGISNENLCGNIHTGAGMEIIAERIYSIFGRVKVIIILRHPLTYLPSAYAFGIRFGNYTQSLEHFLALPGIKKRLPAKLDYQNLIAHYQAKFGENNVLYLPYELLMRDAAQFERYLDDFLGISTMPEPSQAFPKHNSSFSVPYTAILRRVNAVDAALKRITRRQVPRIFNKGTKRLMLTSAGRRIDRSLSRFGQLDPQLLAEHPELVDLLQDHHYQLWDGGLADYNYTFETLS